MKNISRFPRWGAALALLWFAGVDVSAAAAKAIPTHEDIWLMALWSGPLGPKG